MKKRLFFALILLTFFYSTSSVFASPKTEPAGRAASKSYASLPRQELLFQPMRLRECHSPSIVELPDGELLAVYYVSVENTHDALLFGSRKPAGADKWNEPFLIKHTFGRSIKNPVLYLGRDNILWLYWTDEKRWFKWPRDKVRVMSSNDSGKTWSEPHYLEGYSGFLTRNHPVKLKDGSLILPVYADWCTSAAVGISRDDGLTWEKPRFIHYLLGLQPTIIQRSDSNLYALMRTGTWPRLAWQAMSADGGLHWKNQSLSSVKNPGCSLEMLKLKSGNVVLAYNDSRTSRETLNIALSYDDGRTWPHSKIIEFKKDHTNIYPSVIQDRNGLIHIVYSYHNRKSIAHFVTDEKWIEGKDEAARQSHPPE